MSTAEEQLAARSRSTIKRPIYTWTIPNEARLFPTDPSEITMTPYTVAEEIDAVKASKVTGTLQYEFIKAAVVRINGAPVADIDWLDKTSPPCRKLLSDALDAMLMPSEKAVADFRNSLKKGVES